MLQARFGPKSYARAVNQDGSVQENSRQYNAGRATAEGEDLKKLAQKKKAFFQMRLDLEGNRKRLGKGNIVTFLLNSRIVEKSEVNKMLRVGGFTCGQVKGITLNSYRDNQVEVLFSDDVVIDVLKIEADCKKEGIDVIVSKFDHTEEYLMLYGLPLCDNMGVVKEKIIESIRPFVKDVIEVIPCVHKEVVTDDFFKDNYDGNWRVKVIPRSKKQIPNYIVVGFDDEVMAKAVYTKKVGEKVEMCSDCFSTGHFKQTNDCNGPVKWSKYCKDYRDYWECESVEKENEGLDEPALANSEETRIHAFNKALTKDLQEMEQQKQDLEGLVAEQQQDMEKQKELLEVQLMGQSGLEEKIVILTNQVKEIKDSNLKTEKRLKEAEDKLSDSLGENNALRLEVENSKKFIEDLENQVVEDQVLVDTSCRRFSMSMVVANGDFVDEVPHVEEDFVSNDIGSTKVDGDFLPAFHGFSQGSSSSEFHVVESPLPLTPSVDSMDSDAVLHGKRPLGSPGDSERDFKKKGVHPDIGKRICVETINGKKVYLVKSKKSRKSSTDLIYSLLNEENKETSFNLKSISWDYVDENQEDVLKESGGDTC